ncbi:hypothetical protein JTB14_028582 [Gonioctena quinquepunctata]|nr:hypothetical protein JTB14_028582 [Gonioctena quinquepunctata]
MLDPLISHIICNNPVSYPHICNVLNIESAFLANIMTPTGDPQTVKGEDHFPLFMYAIVLFYTDEWKKWENNGGSFILWKDRKAESLGENLKNGEELSR